MILLRSFLSGHIRIKRTLEYYDAGIGPRVPFGGGFGPTVSAIFATALGDYTTLSTVSTMPDGGSITRAGNAMVWVNDGGTAKLTWAPNNLVLQANTFDTSAGWYYGTSPGALSANTIVAPDGNTTASAYTWGTTTADIGFLRIKPTGTYNAATALIYSIWVKVPSGTKSFRINISNWTTTTTTSSDKQATTTWQRFSYAIPAGTLSNTGSIAAALAGASGSPTDPVAAGDVLHVWGPQLEAVTYQTTPSGTYYLNYPTPNTTAAYYGPRFDYDPATLAAKGLLVEGTRTNLCVQSQNLATTWLTAIAGDIVSATAATSPDGTSNGGSFTADGTFALHFVYTTSNGIVANTVQTWSVFLKNPPSNAANFVYVDVYFAGGTNQYISQVVNLTNGTISQSDVGTSASLISRSIQNVGNGWYRVSVTGTIAGTGAPVLAVGIAAAATGNTNDGYGRYVTSSSASFYMFGAQVETANFASSYIPTTTGSLARAAETFTLANYQNRLVESFYIDEETGGSWSANINASATSPLTISTPTFGWVTSVRAYTNAYAGDISSPSWLAGQYDAVGGYSPSVRNSNATYYDSTGMLTYGPNNLVLQSQALATSPWTASNGGVGSLAVLTNDFASAPDSTNTATRVQCALNGGTTSADRSFVSQNLSLVVGTTYVVSFYAKLNTGTSAVMYALIGGAAQLLPTVTNSWQRFNFTATATATGSIRLGLYGGQTPAAADSIDLLLWGVLIEAVTYQTSPRAYIPTTSAAVYQPRYDYDPQSVLQGTGTVSSNTIVFPATFNDGSTCSAVNSYYNGQYVTIGGSNFTITGYTGTSPARTATLNLTPSAQSSQAFTLGNPTWLTPRGMLIEEQRTNLAPYSNGFDNIAWGAAAGAMTATPSATISPDGSNNGYKLIPFTSAVSHYIGQSIAVGGNQATFSIYAKAAGYNYIVLMTSSANASFNISTGALQATSGAVQATSVTSVGNGWYRCSLTATNATSVHYVSCGSSPSAAFFSAAGDGVSGVFIYGLQIEAGSFATSYIPTTTGSVTRVADVVKLSGSALTTARGTNASLALEYYYARNGCIWDLEPVSAGAFLTMSAQGAGGTGWYAAGLAAMTAPTLNAINRQAISWNKTGNFSGSTNNSATVSSSASDYTGTSTVSYLGARGDGSLCINSYVRSLAFYNQRLPDTILAQKSTVGSPY